MHRGKTRAPTMRTSPIVIISAKKEDEKDAHARSRRASCDRRKTLGKRESETDIYSLDSRRDEIRLGIVAILSKRILSILLDRISTDRKNRIESNRVGRRGRREWTGRDGMIGDPERHRVAQRCYGGCFDRSTLVARTTTIKVVSVDRDVTLPVACRSTFIAVIQPRIERPTAERRNGNTQWFSCEPVGTFAIDRSPPRGGHG